MQRWGSVICLRLPGPQGPPLCPAGPSLLLQRWTPWPTGARATRGTASRRETVGMAGLVVASEHREIRSIRGRDGHSPPTWQPRREPSDASGDAQGKRRRIITRNVATMGQAGRATAGTGRRGAGRGGGGASRGSCLRSRGEMAMTSQRPQASGGPKPKPEQRVVSYIASSQAPGSDDETSVARLAGIGKRNEQREALPARSRTSPHLTTPRPSTSSRTRVWPPPRAHSSPCDARTRVARPDSRTSCRPCKAEGERRRMTSTYDCRRAQQYRK